MEEKLRKVMAAALEVPEARIGPEATTETIETWDSVQHLKLVFSLEDAFRVKFTGTEIIELTGYGAIREHLLKKGAK
ncbi:MAG TPA: acyl carrier protein [Elusimicrobiota bacterium]|nr:acyl carrier protein [Elusimicrobiota bacterium]